MKFLTSYYLHPANAALLGIAILLMLVAHLGLRVKFNKKVIFNFFACVLIGPIFFIDFFHMGVNKWYSFPIFLILVDFLYYANHRFFHRFKIHYVHHKPLKNPMQCLEFEIIEFIWTPLTFFLVGDIFQLSPVEMIIFFTFYFSLQLILHSGKDIQWPILISPADHNIHHSKHRYNFSSIFKISDQLFGTYYRKNGDSIEIEDAAIPNLPSHMDCQEILI